MTEVVNEAVRLVIGFDRLFQIEGVALDVQSKVVITSVIHESRRASVTVKLVTDTIRLHDTLRKQLLAVLLEHGH